LQDAFGIIVEEKLVKVTSIGKQILLSLFVVGCTTTPPKYISPPSKPSPPPTDEQVAQPSPISARDLFRRRFREQKYATALRSGDIVDDTLADFGVSTSFYKLAYEELRFFVSPNHTDRLLLSFSALDQQNDHAREVRTFFKQETSFIQNIDDAQNWVRWLESFIYHADLLVRRDDALRLFQDRDRLIASVNPFFYVIFDGRNYNLDYFTIQDDVLWQKRITFSSSGEIVRWQQDPLSLERRGGL
jgi:hypothetical protein